jgi:general secretion pathway protein J
VTRSRCQGGFTLIEVLLAMTLLGVMMVLVFSSLRIASSSWTNGEQHLASANQHAQLYQFFKQQLAAIRPIALPAQAAAVAGLPLPGQVFQGQAHSLRFVASLPQSALRKGWHQFEMGIESNAPEQLVLRLSPLQQGNAEPETVVLAQAVQQFEVSYFGNQQQAEAPGAWQSTWLNADHLPRLIKLQLRLSDGHYWPEMVFAVPVNAVASVNAAPVPGALPGM